jgi:hypothetical protein
VNIDLEQAIAGYVQAAFYCATNGAGDSFPLWDTYTIDDLDQATADEIRNDVTTFIERVLEAFPNFNWEGKPAERVGEDLYMTQAGHGCGFWDGDWENGSALTKLAKESCPPNIEFRDAGGEWWLA